MRKTDQAKLEELLSFFKSENIDTTLLDVQVFHGSLLLLLSPVQKSFYSIQ